MVRASGSAARRRRIAAAALNVASASNQKGVSHTSFPRGEKGPELGFGATKERAVVVTVIVAGVGFVPPGVTELGEIEQVESEGAPLQASATA